MSEKKENEWKSAGTEFAKFHNFEKEPELIAKFIGDHNYKNEAGEARTARRFQREDGVEALASGYQIDKAVEKYGQKVWYRMRYLGQKSLPGGKTVNEFEITVKDVD